MTSRPRSRAISRSGIVQRGQHAVGRTIVDVNRAPVRVIPAPVVVVNTARLLP